MSVATFITINSISYETLLREITILGRLFTSRSLGFNMQAQTQSNWCWAATTVSTSLFYWNGSSWTQCKLASAELNRNDCCNTPVPSACNVPWFLDKALTRTHNFVSVVGAPISFEQVRVEIDAGRPIGARIGWTGGGGHAMVI
jgi:Papain-like cysteine protease AvrRpt2